MSESKSLDQLKQYRQMKARMQILSTYSVGAGITVSRLNEEDQLQGLHRRLRGMPSYMYLSKHEQELETVAHAYLTRYPIGTRAQLQAVPKSGADDEDDKLLQELRGKIKKVIAARGWEVRDDIDEMMERLAEYQDLKAELGRIESVLSALESYRPEWAKLLRLLYVEGLEILDVRNKLQLSAPTYRRWRAAAEREFSKLAR